MADKVDSGDRYTLEFTVEELYFIQHIIVYFGCCLTGNGRGAMDAFHCAASVLQSIDMEEIQQKILKTIGITVPDNAKDTGGVTFLNPPQEVADQVTLAQFNDKNIQ